MKHAMLKDQLIAVLGQIQVDSDLECPPLTGSTKPVDDIPEIRQQNLACCDDHPVHRDWHADPERHEHLRRRSDQVIALDR